MRLAVLVVLTCGCRQIFGLDAPTPLRADGDPSDARTDATDAPVDATGQCFSRPELTLAGCLAGAPTSDLVVSQSTSIDTDSTAACAPLATRTQDVCVIAATSIAVSSSAVVRVTGSRPLVLFSQSTITIDGTLDVASHLGTFGMPSVGPGANPNPTICGAAQAGIFGGGGAGGSFGTVGGDGGRGVPLNSVPGAAGPAISATTFHGGCTGGLGAGADMNVAAAASGGGAVAMFGDTITVSGTVNASAMAGHGGAIGSNGGYGGASGGMIVISTPAISLTNQGQLFAIGGAGGGGSANSAAGGNGGEATSYNNVVAGGQGGNNGGPGGNAFPQPDGGHAGGGANGAGGGGGGGAGAIVIFTNTTFTTPRIFPTAQVSPF